MSASRSPLPFPLTFSTIIEADHSHLTQVAAKVTKRGISLSTRLSLLQKLLTGLIRHDMSEELVMRPAFARYWGHDGAVAAQQDREDHATLKAKLLALYQEILNARPEELDESELLTGIRSLSGEMGMHMREESGVMLPRFERLVEREVSLELGRRYARTLVLTEHVCVVDSSSLSSGRGEEQDAEQGARVGFEVGEKCFGGLLDYANAGPDKFRDILERLEDLDQKSHDRGYLQSRVKEEMRAIGLDAGSGLEGSTMKMKEKL